MDRRSISAVVVVVLLAGCVGGIGVPESSQQSDAGDLEVHAIDVGQADATLVVAPSGETMLIDSGHWDDDGEIVLSYLRDRGIERIDHLVTTHAHADHIGGHADVIEYYETEAEGIGTIYDSGTVSSSATHEEYLDAVERYDVQLIRAHEGDEVPIEGAEADILHPPADSELEALNANSLVVHLEHEQVGFLFTGDIGAEEERQLAAEYGDDLSATVYQVGHHGSYSSSSDALLDAVQPSVAVVSSAYDSPYGHPDDEPLERLAARNVDTYWTALHGSIVFRSDGDAVEVATQTAATTAPLEFEDAAASEASPDDGVEERGTITPSLRGGTAAVGRRAVA
ncbi:competence protein ComEC [Natronoarchaeum philippinense]|uniref:Competence protein ComEC n=1 Tax=Natronoarchaeum philippinense TaxID=558529 RepID=A0A285N367_NATPI|nr:ComEC/Rec2 family competence protein [Natronoarchaeum philippinense]SNZ03924.1 competence protein ComEC [Natronoarchaeum philippinense]